MFGKKASDSKVPAELPGRNDPCHCGSGKKYKKCCEEKDAAATHSLLEKKWKEAEKVAAQKAEEQQKEAAKNPNAPPAKSAPQSNLSDHRRNTMAVPKFNMPRRTGGG